MPGRPLPIGCRRLHAVYRLPSTVYRLPSTDLFTRLLNVGIAAAGLLLVVGSYSAIRHLPGSFYRVAWLGGISGAAILAAWMSRGTDGRRRQLERDNAEAEAVLEIA